MRSGTGAIVQADLNSGRWRGRADVLLKVNRPSALGAWSYEVVDTKLARETRGGTILQLCLYSELIADIQGCLPDNAHVVTPGCGFQPQTFRLHDFLAAIIAAGTDVMTQVHFAADRFDGQWRICERIVCAVHAALR